MIGVRAANRRSRSLPAPKAAGIPGIKYLDGSSRSQGDGSYNYVVFDDADVRVLAGIPPSAANMLDLAGTDPTWKGKTAEAFEKLRMATQDRYLLLKRPSARSSAPLASPFPTAPIPMLAKN